ncbi:MAG: methyltransferase domain-containing protein [Aggregatilineales bacterium]
MPESINFDRAVPYYDATRRLPVGLEATIGAFIAEKGQLKLDETVLEIGIGTGRIALPLAPHVQAYHGVDISIGMLGELLKKRQDKHIYIAQADALALPHPDNSFDAIVVVHVFHLVADLRAVLDELQRVMEPGSRVIHCFNRYDDNRFDPIADAWDKHRPQRRHGQNWTNTDEVLREAGWTMLDEQHYEFTRQDTPQDFLDNVEQQRWSSTWDLSTEEIAPGIAAIRKAITDYYDDNTQAEIAIPMKFVVQIMQPPQQEL